MNKTIAKLKIFYGYITQRNLDKSIRDLIADRNLQLAGFTLTAIAFIIVFYNNSISEAPFLLTWLLVALFVLFLGSFVAHTSENLAQIYFADVLQYIGVIILMASFSLFLEDKIGNQAIVILPVILAVFFVLILTRGFLRLIKSYKQYKRRKKQTLDKWMDK